MAELVPIAEAARRLTAGGDKVERSTLSRYLARHAEALPTVRRGKENLVEFEALARHRKAHLASGEAAEPGSSAPTQTKAQAIARKEAARAGLAELALAEALREVCPVAEVEAEVEKAVADALAVEETIVREEAAKAARALKLDARLVRPHIKSAVRAFRSKLADALETRMAAFTAAQRAAAGG